MTLGEMLVRSVDPKTLEAFDPDDLACRQQVQGGHPYFQALLCYMPSVQNPCKEQIRNIALVSVHVEMIVPVSGYQWSVVGGLITDNEGIVNDSVNGTVNGGGSIVT